MNIQNVRLTILICMNSFSVIQEVFFYLLAQSNCTLSGRKANKINKLNRNKHLA